MKVDLRIVREVKVNLRIVREVKVDLRIVREVKVNLRIVREVKVDLRIVGEVKERSKLSYLSYSEATFGDWTWKFVAPPVALLFHNVEFDVMLQDQRE